MATGGASRNVRFWRWSFVISALIIFLLGSAYYNIDKAYIVHVDFGGQAEKTTSVVEGKTNKYAAPGLKHDDREGLESARNLDTSSKTPVTGNFDEGIHEVQISNRKQAEQSNEHLRETFAENGSADVSSDSVSKYNTRNKLQTNIKETPKKKDLPFNNDGRALQIEGHGFDDYRLENPQENGERVFTSFKRSGQYLMTTNTSSSNSSLEAENEGEATKQDTQNRKIDIGDKDDEMSPTTVGKKQVNRIDTMKSNRLVEPSGYAKQGSKYHPGRPRMRISPKFPHMMPRRPQRPRMKYDIPVGPDTDYAIQDLKTLRMTKGETSTFVLIVTYARSGSTWLGAITNQADETFYVFEPLQRFIKEGYYKKNLVCFNNNTCRKPRLFSETHNFAITTFHSLFTCQFTKLHPKAVEIFLHNVKTGGFKKCINVTFSVKKCLQELEKICLAKSHRALKTIRISMEVVKIMMDLWPNLKVVNLVRDPRGITNSRLKRSTFFMSNNTVSHSHDLCERMYTDVEHELAIEKKDATRIILVFYEALAERPLEGLHFIYKFLGISVTENVVNWVYNSTHAQKGKGSYFGTMRSNAAEVAYLWRKKLALNKIEIMDNICLNVYRLLGFLPIKTSTDHENLSHVSTRQSIKHSNWFS